MAENSKKKKLVSMFMRDIIYQSKTELQTPLPQGDAVS